MTEKKRKLLGALICSDTGIFAGRATSLLVQRRKGPKERREKKRKT
jgi:hypothetical protein